VPKDPATQVDPGRLAFGQERMQATPLQMLLVAATIANRGLVPRPYLVQEIVGHDGSVVQRAHPQTLGTAIKPQTAAELTQMMISVVQAGTGVAAQIPGIQVAGKTGTAELGPKPGAPPAPPGQETDQLVDGWFICFAPARKPKLAVAVMLIDASGDGGTTAAPIARSILSSAL
jgi:penicillin-binding protein A